MIRKRVLVGMATGFAAALLVAGGKVEAAVPPPWTSVDIGAVGVPGTGNVRMHQ